MSWMMKEGSRRRCISNPGIFLLSSSVFTTLLIIITTRLQMMTTTNSHYQHLGRQRQPPLTIYPQTLDTTREESEDSRHSTIGTTLITCHAHPPWPASRTVTSPVRSCSLSSQEGQLCPTCWCWCSRSVISYHSCIVSFTSFSFTQFTSLPSSNTLLQRFLNLLTMPLVITRSLTRLCTAPYCTWTSANEVSKMGKGKMASQEV